MGSGRHRRAELDVGAADVFKNAEATPRLRDIGKCPLKDSQAVLEEWQLDGGRAKLAPNGAVELYRLSDDLGEHHNLASSQPAKRDELLDALLGWIKSTGALLPSERNPAYDPATTKAKGAKGGRKQ